MDHLELCVQKYEQLMERDYYLTLENGVQLHIFFKKCNFVHLLGLHKLSDLAYFSRRAHNSADTLYRKIRSGGIKERDLRRSRHFHRIRRRFELFPQLESVFSGKAVVDFNPTLLERCHLTAEYILYVPHEDGWLHLAVGINNGECFPESFFFDQSDYYLKGQKLVAVEELRIGERPHRKKKEPKGHRQYA